MTIFEIFKKSFYDLLLNSKALPCMPFTNLSESAERDNSFDIARAFKESSEKTLLFKILSHEGILRIIIFKLYLERDSNLIYFYTHFMLKIIL